MVYVMTKKDTKENHVENRNKRHKRSAIINLILFIILFLVMNLRYINSCYRVIGGFFDKGPFPRMRTHIHFEIIYSVKIVSLLVLLTCFILLKPNKYFFKQKPILYYTFVVSFVLIAICMAAIVVLLYTEIIKANTVNFLVIFFLDMDYIILMTSAVMQFR